MNVLTQVQPLGTPSKYGVLFTPTEGKTYCLRADKWPQIRLNA